MTQHKIQQIAMSAALLDLRDAAEQALSTRHAVSFICTAVANLIAGSGAHGSSAQQAMMELASGAGFVPEYYADSIRVTYVKE